MKKNIIISFPRIICFIIIVAILATLIFIFSNSLKSREDSAGQSSEVAGTVKPIVDPKDEIPFETFEHYVRKCAHFLEFMLLGFELFALLFVLSQRSLKNINITAYLLILFASTLTALADETIQIVSDRGSAVTDVWIDLAGAVSGTFVCFLILWSASFINMIIHNRKKKKAQ